MSLNTIVELTTEIVTAHISNNSVSPDQLPELIKNVYSALSSLGSEAASDASTPNPLEPAVSVRKSLADSNRIISMIDGRGYASLKRHIGAHGYTPESYRAAFGLKSDYPMVATGYTERRRELAKQIGLGRKRTVNSGLVEPIGEGTLDFQAPAAKATKAKVKKPRRAGSKVIAPETQNAGSVDQDDDKAREQSSGAT